MQRNGPRPLTDHIYCILHNTASDIRGLMPTSRARGGKERDISAFMAESGKNVGTVLPVKTLLTSFCTTSLLTCSIGIS